MKRIATIIFWFALMILCSFNFYIVFPTGSNINWNGVVGAKVGVTVGILALLFLSYRKIERIVLKKGLIQKRIKTIYDFVPATLFVLFATGGRYAGDRIDDSLMPNSGFEFNWLFSWGLTNKNAYLVIVFSLIMLLLYRCYKLVGEIEINMER